MRLLSRLVAAAALAVLACVGTGCVSGIPSGATLGIDGITVVDDDGGEVVGVLVRQLHEKSPLVAEGVRRGDILTSVDGESTGRAAELSKRIFAAGWEKPVRLGVRRGDAEREIEILPAPCYRRFRIGIFIPFLWGTQGDVVEVVDPYLVGIGTGPDTKGCLLLSCVGFMSYPESNAVFLGVLYVGTGIGPPVDRPEKKPAPDPMDLR